MKESSSNNESSFESDEDSDESVNTSNLLSPRTNIIQLIKELSSNNESSFHNFIK
jgi:hypothetical protein